jgi:hypothetical protein
VQQFGPENLQPLAQLFDQMINFFFEIGRLSQLIADVDIHAKPQSTGSGSREALSSLLIGFYTRAKVRDRKLKLFSFVILSETKDACILPQSAISVCIYIGSS